MEPHKALEQVNDRHSFFAFVDALIADCKTSADWQNATVESFLGAALAWAEDAGIGEEPSWKAFATFLYCGKTYE